jgi:hypothetical protein
MEPNFTVLIQQIAALEDIQKRNAVALARETSEHDQTANQLAEGMSFYPARIRVTQFS